MSNTDQAGSKPVSDVTNIPMSELMGDDLRIPAALDRTKDMTKAEIDSIRLKAINNAKSKKGAGKLVGSKAPKRDNLTEVDKANIKALKKAGGDKVSIVKEVGAKLKSEVAAKGKSAKIAKPKKASNGELRPGSKSALIADMLKRKEGCTTADVLKATGWPSVSMPAQAKAAGLKLRKEKTGKVTRYWAA